MGYIKSAVIAIREAGCIWLNDDLIERLRDAGHKPQTRRVICEGFRGPVEVEAVPIGEGIRLLSIVRGEDRDDIAEALAEAIGED